MRKIREIPSLNGIRAASILIVIIAHAGFDNIFPAVFGVTVFFFLSGYLIATLLFTEVSNNNTISIKNFYLRRALRILPPLFVVLITAYTMRYFEIIGGDFVLVGLISQLLFFYNYFEMYSGIYPYGPTGTSVLWSLSVEEHYYMILPIIFLPVFFKKGLKGAIFACLMCFVVALIARMLHYYIIGTEAWIIGRSTETRFDSIVFGLLLAALHHYQTDRRLFGENDRALLVWCLPALALLIFCFLYREDSFRAVYRYTLQGIALIPLFHYAIRRPQHFLFRPLNWRIFVWTGVLSYSAYLTHDIILKGLLYNGIVEREGAVLLAFGLILTALVSVMLYVFVERPLFGMRRRLKAPIEKSVENPV